MNQISFIIILFLFVVNLNLWAQRSLYISNETDLIEFYAKSPSSEVKYCTFNGVKLDSNTAITLSKYSGIEVLEIEFCDIDQSFRPYGVLSLKYLRLMFNKADNFIFLNSIKQVKEFELFLGIKKALNNKKINDLPQASDYWCATPVKKSVRKYLLKYISNFKPKRVSVESISWDGTIKIDWPVTTLVYIYSSKEKINLPALFNNINSDSLNFIRINRGRLYSHVHWNLKRKVNFLEFVDVDFQKMDSLTFDSPVSIFDLSLSNINNNELLKINFNNVVDTVLISGSVDLNSLKNRFASTVFMIKKTREVRY